MSKTSRQLVPTLLLALSLTLAMPLYAARDRDDRSSEGRGISRIVHRILKMIRGLGDEIGVPRP